MRRIACLLILVSCASSCASAQVDPARVYESGVAAMVNGEVITVGEVRAASRRAFVGVSETARRELFERKLQGMILHRVINQAAARIGMAVNPRHVLSHIERQKVELGGEDEYRNWLAEMGMSHEEYVAKLTLDLLGELYIRVLAEVSRGAGNVLRPRHSVNPTVREVRAYYERHLKDEFSDPAEADVWYMPVAVSSPNSGTKEKALAKAKRIKAELDTGADFATLAQKHSAITAETGGHAGWQRRSSSLLKPIIDYAFDGEIGKVSDPIEFGAGWLLVRCAARKEPHVVPFTEAQKAITNELRAERLKRALAAVESRIIREAYIQPVKYKTALIRDLKRPK